MKILTRSGSHPQAHLNDGRAGTSKTNFRAKPTSPAYCLPPLFFFGMSPGSPSTTFPGGWWRFVIAQFFRKIPRFSTCFLIKALVDGNSWVKSESSVRSRSEAHGYIGVASLKSCSCAQLRLQCGSRPRDVQDSGLKTSGFSGLLRC